MLYQETKERYGEKNEHEFVDVFQVDISEYDDIRIDLIAVGIVRWDIAATDGGVRTEDLA